MLRKLAVLAVALVLTPTLAWGQQQAGNWEFSLSGSGVNNEDFDSGGFQINGTLGYYISKEFEVSFRQGITYADANVGTDWNFSSILAADYHFDLGQWQPFIGANIGYIYGDLTNDTWVAGPEIGVKYFVNKTTFVYGIMQYEFYFDSGDDDFSDDGTFIYGLGIGFVF